MKLWATLARYAYRSGEFQVRLPLGDARRAKLAGQQAQCGKFRVEKGTLVFGGASALRAMVVLLNTPQDLCEAAQEIDRAPAHRRPALWWAFATSLEEHLASLIAYAPAEEPSGPC